MLTQVALTWIIAHKWLPRCNNPSSLILRLSTHQTRKSYTKNYSKRSFERKTLKLRSIEPSCRTRVHSTFTKMVLERLRIKLIRSIRGSSARLISKRPIGWWGIRRREKPETNNRRLSTSRNVKMTRWKNVRSPHRSADTRLQLEHVLAATSREGEILALRPNSTSRNKNSSRGNSRGSSSKTKKKT